MSYYQDNKEDRLIYQSYYNIINIDKYKTYQQEYFQKNKERIIERNKQRSRRENKEKAYKPLPKYKLDIIERMLRKKLKDYHDTIEQQEVALEMVNDTTIEPLAGFTIRNNKFKLVFD